MAVDHEALTLPLIPTTWNDKQTFRPLGKLTQATQRNIEPVGVHFLSEARRKRHKRTFSEDDRVKAAERTKRIEDDDDGEISEEEDPNMLTRDAKDWKGQDHYAVLGLSKYRYKATPEQIKRAHRKKILKHHPDKRAAQGSSDDDSFFKCIQKATEILLDPARRRQYDSVDEAADVDEPTKKETKNKGFFKSWGPVFENEARFSKVSPVPTLGNDSSTKAEVEHFYNFWYNFDSWRSFEYLDEDIPDDSADRDQKRQVERKNMNQRKKKKTEDTARLRKLVDDALSLDERIAKFKREEKAQRNKKKDEREAEERRRREEEQQRREQEEREAKAREAAAQVERAEGKKAKEAAKNAAKKHKRTIRNAPKEANYFESAGQNISPERISAILDAVDNLITKMSNEEIEITADKLSSAGKDPKNVKAIFVDLVQQMQALGKINEAAFQVIVS